MTRYEPSVWACLAYLAALGAGLTVTAVAVIWWGANHPGGIVDRLFSAFTADWMGEDR